MREIAFIDVMSDEGFKRVFGVEENMILLLEAAFQDRKITKVKYLDKEKFGLFRGTRRSIYDLHCEDDQGRKFIVEVQYKEVDNFINRAIYYVSSCLQRQTRAGKNWDNRMTPVYFLALTLFDLPGTPPDQWLHRFEIREEYSGQRMTDNIRFVYVELGKFNKTDGELSSDQERMAYFMKNAASLDRRPKSMMQKMYDTLFSSASFAGMSRKKQEKYMEWWRIRQDNYNADRRAKRIAREEGLAEGRAEGLELGKAEGRAEGRAEGKAEGRKEGAREQAMQTARTLLQLGVSTDIIVQSTGLTSDEVATLR